MAVYKIFPHKDATIYSMYPTMNTGIDAINQVSNLNFALNTSPSVARSLIAFDSSEIADVINNKIKGSNWNTYLKSWIATAQGVVEDTVLEVYPVSKAWNQGTGTYLDQPLTTDGTCWESSQFEGGTTWDISGVSGNYTIGSYYDPNYSVQGGGSWFTLSGSLSLKQTQTFTPRSKKDLEVDTTKIVEDWYSGSMSNNGFILKWEDGIEFNPNKLVQPVLQYYSIDTNTIFPPELEFRWDNSEWNPTSSIEVLDSPNLYVSLDENPGIFYNESVNRFRVNVREKYPTRVFQTSSLYTTQHYLPQTSYYAIKDLDTNEFVIDFDDTYTKISADATSSYFEIYMDGLEPERYYQALIKVVNGNGSVTIYDEKDYSFKVING
jgi:hypothetical protein